MIAPDELIVSLLAVTGRPIVGRIRLQKMVYLLDQKGLGSGLAFNYHYYGPYSRELDNALDRARALRGVIENIKYRYADGMPYSVFSLEKNLASGVVGQLPEVEARGWIDKMMEKSSTVLELSATIHWLIQTEKCGDWKTELKRRKGLKAQAGRTEEAIQLLECLDLLPA